MEAADIAPLIKGPAGTEVTLTVERDGQNVECTVRPTLWVSRL